MGYENPHPYRSLLAAFPDAMIVQSHRSPLITVPSTVKMMYELWGYNADIDKYKFATDMMEWSAVTMTRSMNARDRLKLEGRIVDVRYSDIRNNAMFVVQTIYDKHGFKLTAKAAQAMQQWEQDNEQGKHGKHIYSLEEFGLKEDQINDSFKEYINRFSTFF